MLTALGVCTTILLLLFSSMIKVQGKPQQTKPGCRYEGRRYQEGAAVTTAEPCLQCRCVEGSLRCRLRVCPRLPQPSPPGCRIRSPGDNVCCPELVCGNDEDENENVLQRSNAAASPYPRVEEGCLYEGVRYGSGSAMMGSRRCEYCYCISGARRCIRPKCLLPLPGCAPLYAPHSCCPVAYNCTRQAEFSTTLAAISGNGCRTGQRIYQEGEMVRDIAGKATCDNCFCAMGAIRCVPLACAPPLQGCKPIVREGQCCPSTYNCSGTIEVKAAQNYASYAFISKDYAKFRKETNFYPAIHDTALSSVEGRGHRVVNEALESDVGGIGIGIAAGIPEIITEKLAMATESLPTLETETMNNEILSETTDYLKYTTRDQEQLTATTTELSTSTDASNFDPSATTAASTVSIVDEEAATSLSAAYLREVSTILEDPSTETPIPSTTTTTTTSSVNVTLADVVAGTYLVDEDAATASLATAITDVPPELTPIIATSTTESNEKSASQGQELENTPSDKVHLETTTTSINLDTTMTTTTSAPTSTAANKTTTMAVEATSQSVLAVEKDDKLQTKTTTTTTTEGSNKAQNSSSSKEKEKVDVSVEEKTSVIAVKKPSVSTSIIVPDDMLVMNVTVKTNVAVGHIHGVTINPIIKPIPPDIEAILNITNRGKGEDYEYDYSEPTLPPSLPNVRIIPFVAADALVKDKDEDVVAVASPSAAVGAVAAAATPTVTGYPSSGGMAVGPPELGPTDANFYDIVTQENRFNPPEKTEGGFVPREPSYFDPLFHSSDLNLEIGTGVTVAPKTSAISNPHRKNDELPNNCLYEEHEYIHGQVLPNSAHCVICRCYYGEIACSNQKCPPLKIGCRQVEDPSDKCCSKVVCVDGVESPTVVLDRLDSTSSSQHEPTVSPDPFRDVIKTEPAPDLPSLIGDLMIPYYVDHSITSPSNSSRIVVESSSNLDKFVVPSQQENDSSNVKASAIPMPSEDLDRNLVSHHNSSNFNADEVKLTTAAADDDVNPIIKVEENERVDEPGKETDQEEEEEEEEDSIFSLDGVLDLFFSEPSSSSPKSTETTSQVSPISGNSTESTARTTSETTTSLPSSTSSVTAAAQTTTRRSTSPPPNSTTVASSTTTTRTTTTTTTRTTTMTTATKAREKESAAGVSGGLLKVAGCNIYGRMYRVGRIITELSGPCLECRCTELGVQCKSLRC